LILWSLTQCEHRSQFPVATKMGFSRDAYVECQPVVFSWSGALRKFLPALPKKYIDGSVQHLTIWGKRQHPEAVGPF
jgi:hypothetical protein